MNNQPFKNQISIEILKQELIIHSSFGLPCLYKYQKVTRALQLKHNIDRIQFIEYLYEAIAEDVELFQTNEICKTLVKLVQDKMALKLDWKILYDKLEIVSKGKFYKSDNPEELLKLAKVVREYFDTDEMVTEILAKLNVFDSESIASCLGLMNILTPTKGLSQQTVHAIFATFTQFKNFDTVDKIMLDFCSRYLKDGHCLSLEQVQTLYVIGTRLLDVPVGTLNSLKAHTSQYHYEVVEKTFARVIVYTLGEEFHILVNSLQHFCHPSNSGAWSLNIAKLLACIATETYERAKDGRKDDVKLVCKQLLVLLKLLLFSKSPQVVHEVRSAIKTLAYLHPETIFDELLPTIITSLTSVTEPYRVQVCIDLLTFISPILFNSKMYPSGCESLTTILELVIDGVGVNDLKRCMSTLFFISSVFTTVPIVDCSKSMDTNGFEDVTNDLASPTIVNSAVLELCRLSTASFQDWVRKFVDSVFVLAENLGEGRNPHDLILVECAVSACRAVFTQLSKEIETDLCTYLMRKVDTVVPAGIELIGRIFQFLPSRMKFIEVCVSNICDEVEEGACSSDVDSSNLFGMAKMSDVRCHWFQSILAHCLVDSDVLAHRSLIEKVMKVMVEKCVSKTGYEYTAKVLVNVIKSCTRVYIKEYKSIKEFEGDAYKRWGEVANLDIEWHKPSQQEIEFGTALAKEYLAVSIQKLNETKSAGRTCRKWLTLLGSALEASCTFCQPVPGAMETSDEDVKLFSRNLNVPIFDCGFLFKNGDQQYDDWIEKLNQVRYTLLEFGDYLLAHRSDDSDTITCFLKTIGDHLAPSSGLKNVTNRYQMAKSVFRIGKDKSKLPRSVKLLGIYRVYLRHVDHNLKAYKATPLVQQLMEMVWKLCIQKYSAVRTVALGLLSRVLDHYKDLRIPTFKFALGVLKPTASDEEILGALDILSNRKWMMGLFVYNWKFAADFVNVILQLHTLEKAQVVNKITNVAQLFHYFHCIRFAVKVSPRLATAGKRFLDIDHKLIVEEEKRIAMKETVFKKSYDNAIGTIIQSINDKINWRFIVFGLEFLNRLLTFKAAIPTKMIDLMFLLVKDSHPQIRENANGCLANVMKIIKLRSTIHGTNNITSIKRTVTFKDRDYETILASVPYGQVHSYDNQVFIDKNVTGTLFSPPQVRVYKGTIFMGAFHDKDSDDAHELFRTLVLQKEFWNNAVHQREIEHTTFQTKQLYKKIFGLFHDSVHVIVPILKELVLKEDGQSQRTAAEFVAMLLRGSKHYAASKQQEIETLVFPIFVKGIENATSESIYYWVSCLKYVFKARDPKRYTKLITYILASELDVNSTSYFILLLISTVLEVFRNRMAPVVPGLLVRLSTMLSSPYQQVRECLGKAIQLCLSSDIQFQITNAQEYLTNTSDCFFLSPHSKSQMKKILDELTSIDFASIPADQLNKTKSLLCWFASCITSHLSVIMEPFLLFFTKISIKIQQSSDVDLNEMASQAAKLVPNYTHSIDQVHSEIMLFSEICISDLLIDQITESASWHTKCRVLPMLQVLFYKHLYFITPTLKKEVVNLLLFLIQDTHIQVRNIAQQTLTGTVQCAARELIPTLLVQFNDLLSQSKLPAVKDQGYHQIMNKRHASVLGISAMILAFPYDLPKWMPQALVTLSTCSHDPAPIKTTVTNTFGEFKRTHQDTWEKDKLSMTSDELYAISDLLHSQSYFA